MAFGLFGAAGLGSAARGATPAPTATQEPGWLPSAVIYEVNTSVFSPQGNFAGILARMDQLQKLGVTTLWLMPIHPVGQVKSFGSLYCVRDYYGINPKYGTADDFRRLIKEAHRRKMKVVMDLVADHTAWDNPWITAHPDWYKHDAKGQIVPPNDAWKDVAGLDFASPGLRRAMLDVMRYWVRDFDIDGYRCDAAEMVPVDFWETARVEVKKIKPQFLMLAEAARPDLMAQAFDLDYGWPLLRAMQDVMGKGAPASRLQETWEAERLRFRPGALHMQISDDHDEERATVTFGAAGARVASALLLTLDGVPLLYNGMEVGDTGKWEPIVWDRSGAASTRAFYQQLLALRRSHPALQQGATAWQKNSDPARILTYTRRGNGEEFLVAINVSKQPFTGRVEIDKATRWTDITPGIASNSAPVALPNLSLDAQAFRIFRRSLP
ncbi:MAG: alpha-amylase family glycosyl hydrolase [Armatimonadota bacterium]|nr:alpha-amylase family glycosyl hydrolase [Armatimonadota bacterium]